MKCEYCDKEHDGEYASSRFCKQQNESSILFAGSKYNICSCDGMAYMSGLDPDARKGLKVQILSRVRRDARDRQMDRAVTPMAFGSTEVRTLLSPPIFSGGVMVTHQNLTLKSADSISARRSI